MKIEVTRDELRAALSRVMPAVRKKSTLPILSNVLLRTNSDTVTVSGNNMRLGISAEAHCEAIERQGDACINAAKLSAILEKLPDGTLHIATDDKFGVELKLGTSRFRLSGLDSIQFPAMDVGATGKGVEIDLSQALSVVEHAQAKDETKTILCGVAFSPSGVTATDGHRLATVALALPVQSTIIVPTEAVASIKNLGQCRLAWSDDNLLVAESAGVRLFCRLIEGEYPDVEQVIPRSCEVTASCDPVSLQDMIARVSVLADRACGVRLSIGDGRIEATLADKESGSEARDSIEAATNGELDIVFNPKYVGQALAALPPTGAVVLGFNQSDYPMLVTSSVMKEAKLVLMPHRS